KAVLLISAAPITVLMNSVRIAIGGVLVQYFGVDWLEGFTHFFEGWVIFLACIIILFGLARLMLFLHPAKMSLVEALDLDTDGLGTQAMRLQFVRPSAALIAAAAVMIAGVVAWQAVPQRSVVLPERDVFAVFPRQMGEWRQVGVPQTLEASVAKALKADDYHSVNFQRAAGEPSVGFFTAWYKNQSNGGV
ncbi:MAG: exosortase-associated EpsI family protein, partial [Pseudomonadota bacterium]